MNSMNRLFKYFNSLKTGTLLVVAAMSTSVTWARVEEEPRALPQACSASVKSEDSNIDWLCINTLSTNAKVKYLTLLYKDPDSIGAPETGLPLQITQKKKVREADGLSYYQLSLAFNGVLAGNAQLVENTRTSSVESCELDFTGVKIEARNFLKIPGDNAVKALVADLMASSAVRKAHAAAQIAFQKHYQFSEFTENGGWIGFHYLRTDNNSDPSARHCIFFAKITSSGEVIANPLKCNK